MYIIVELLGDVAVELAHTWIHISTHTHKHTLIYMYICIHQWRDLVTCAGACTHVDTHTHAYLHTHTHIYIYIYIYIYIPVGLLGDVQAELARS